MAWRFGRLTGMTMQILAPARVDIRWQIARPKYDRAKPWRGGLTSCQIAKYYRKCGSASYTKLYCA